MQSSSTNPEFLATKIVQHQKEVGDLIVNTLDNFEEIKNKRVIILQKYLNLFKLMLKLLAQLVSQNVVDEALKQRAGALVSFWGVKMSNYGIGGSFQK